MPDRRGRAPARRPPRQPSQARLGKPLPALAHKAFIHETTPMKTYQQEQYDFEVKRALILFGLLTITVGVPILWFSLKLWRVFIYFILRT